MIFYCTSRAFCFSLFSRFNLYLSVETDNFFPLVHCCEQCDEADLQLIYMHKSVYNAWTGLKQERNAKFLFFTYFGFSPLIQKQSVYKFRPSASVSGDSKMTLT